MLEGEDIKCSIVDLKSRFRERFKFELDDNTIHSAVRNMNFNFQFAREDTNNKTWRNTRILKNPKLYDVIEMDMYHLWLSSDFSKELLNHEIFRAYFQDNVAYAILKYEQLLQAGNYQVQHGFILYEKYSRKNVFRILNWEENPVAQNVGGYMISKDQKGCAIFVNYDNG